MTPQDFDYLKSLLKERSGLILSDDKGYLIESRLGPIVKKASLEDITALVAELKKAGSEDLRSQVTEAMTTNESFFFRDKLPFNHFKEAMIPHMLETRKIKRSFRLWCAASSTGQEPYSLAITLQEMADQIQNWRPEIVATDLSSEVLEKARSGLYSQFEVQRGLAAPLLVKYFEQVGSLWQINSTIRGMIQYKQYNLLDSFVPLGTFDIVFCRNVLIYFDQKTKIDILNRIAAQTAPDGFIVLGAAETIVGLTDAYVPVEGRRGMFQKATAQNAGILKSTAAG